ncbi:MAG TPA: CPBP family intramembrane glutamic endopeptidase [Candidatus Saccharimonadales bacterium]|nr:CPBP family intramembrane glutamic endopeptidase [Candidatus Saccharimonadales bacterium]
MSDDSSKVVEKGVWGPFSAIGLTFLAFAGAQLFAVFLAGLWPALNGWPSERANAWLDSIGTQFVFVLVSEALIMGVLWLFMRRRHISWRSLGYNRRPQWRDLAYATLGFAVYFVLLIIVSNAVGSLTGIDLDQKQELGFDNVFTDTQRLMAFISLVVLPPVVEETLFRGFLFGGLRRRLPFWWATLLTSILFAAPHLLASSEGLLWVAGLDTFILSLFLCYIREKTGSLWACIGLHAIKNGFAFMLLFIIT